MTELEKAQQEYIDFLSAEIDRTAVYLNVHDMYPPIESMKKGDELRERIKKITYDNAHTKAQEPGEKEKRRPVLPNRPLEEYKRWFFEI